MLAGSTIQRAIAMALVGAVLAVGCESDRVAPAYPMRTPIYYNLDGTVARGSTPITDGYQYMPDPNDAGSFGQGTWNKIEGGKIVPLDRPRVWPGPIRAQWALQDFGRRQTEFPEIEQRIQNQLMRMAAGYPPVSGKLAERIAKMGYSDALKDVYPEQRPTTRQLDGATIEIIEHVVDNQVVAVSAHIPRPVNPVSAIPFGTIKSIRYGQHPGLERDASDMLITDADEMASIYITLVSESHAHAFMRVQTPVHSLFDFSIEQLKVTHHGMSLGHGCSLGIWIEQTSGEVTCLSGHIKDGNMVEFRNPALAGAMERIAAARGIRDIR